MRRSVGLALAGVTVVLAVTSLGHPGAAIAVGPCSATTGYGNPLPSPTMTATKLTGGFNFLEGPVWDASTGTLLMSNMQNPAGPERVQASSILRFTPPATVRTVVADSGSNGLAITPDGSTILAATHDRRSVSSYRLSDGARGVVAAVDPLRRRFNSPNDLTVRADGTVYFTDPSFQRGARTDDQRGRTGVFRVRAGVVSLVDGTVGQPNGIVLSPDGRTLYVGGNAANTVFAYPVAADGSTGTRTRFATVPGPDGATVDCAGNIYWASYNDGKVHVFSPAGRRLGTISAGRHTTNVAFGGADRRTLYVTSGSPSSGGLPGDFGVHSVWLNVPGHPY